MVVYGLPYSVSLPVGYYNMDNLRAADHDAYHLGRVIAACKTLMADGHKTPMWWGWSVRNWFFQALMWSQGDQFLKMVRLISRCSRSSSSGTMKSSSESAIC